MQIEFESSAFRGNGNDNLSLDIARNLLKALTMSNMSWLKVIDSNYRKKYHKKFPSIYDIFPQIKYIKEPSNSEKWLDIPRILIRGGGDCEDLSSWRAAELRYHGVDAWPDIYRTKLGYHVVVRIRRNSPFYDIIEDTSKKLGMEGNTPFRYGYATNKPLISPQSII